MKRVLVAVGIVVVVGVVAFSVYSRSGPEPSAAAVGETSVKTCGGDCAACPDVACGSAACLDKNTAASAQGTETCSGHPECTCGGKCKDNPDCTCPEHCKETCSGACEKVCKSKGTCPGTCGAKADVASKTPCQKKACPHSKKGST